MHRSKMPAAVLLALMFPGAAWACACGCGVFDVATGTMFPEHAGAVVFIEQDFMDQNQNWSGRSAAPAAANADKRIRTNFWTLGAQYMFTRSWSAQLDVPFWQRRFVTTTDSGALAVFDHGALGDVRLRVIYTGLAADLSSGLTLGVKLPSGDARYANFDPDTQIGSGSTDVLLGGYYLGRLTADNRWSWFGNVQWQQPVAHRANYRPGADIDAIAGIYYDGWRFGGAVHLAPLLQVIGAWRGHDGGPQAHPLDSGYTRVFITPGLELDVGRTRIYADVSRALYTNVSGNQLIARTLFKLSISLHL